MDATAPSRARPQGVRQALGEVLGASRRRPSFGVYLAALALLPVKWLSPLPYPQAGLVDLVLAAAAAAWGAEALASRRRPRLRGVHLAFGAYLALTAASAAASYGWEGTSGPGVAIAAELVAIAIMTSDYGREPQRRRAIGVVVLLVVAVTAVEAAAAVVLFYAHVRTSLLGSYGLDLVGSGRYPRVAAGFHSAPLLGSFCIFASAVLALEESSAALRPARRAGQMALAAVVVLTVSRAVVGFAFAAAIRAAARRGSRRARQAAVACAVVAVAAMVAGTVVDVRVDPTRPLEATLRPWETNANPRLQGMTSAAATLADHPLVGSGPGRPPGRYDGEAFRAHFTPLEVAATTGLPALFALSASVWLLWRHRRRPTGVATWSGLAGLAVDGLGQDVDHFRHVWVMLGLADADRAPPTR